MRRDFDPPIAWAGRWAKKARPPKRPGELRSGLTWITTMILPTTCVGGHIVGMGIEHQRTLSICDSEHRGNGASISRS